MPWRRVHLLTQIKEVKQMSGPNPSQNPDIDYTSLDAVLLLLANQTKFTEELARSNELHIYLLKLQGWKNDNDQRIANHLPLLPVPIPPKWYVPPVLPPLPPKPPKPPISFSGPNQWGQYIAVNDDYVVGDKQIYNGIMLIKIGHETPFGTSYWWERAL